MIQRRVKQAVQILISLGIAIWIFWFIYKDVAFESLLDQIMSSNWAWIILSLLVSMLAYLTRSWRWTLLINTEDAKKVSLVHAYHALMVGYLINMLIPRAGEVARCGALTRTNGISTGYLIGTVIVERSIDLLCLVSTILLAFFVERELFLNLASQLVDVASLGQKIISNLPLVLGGIAVLILVIRYVFIRFADNGLINKIQHFFREILSGLRKIGGLTNPAGFWTSSIFLWFLYFLTMYTISLGIPSTANLSSGEVLLVMVMGSIGMVAPVQGGIGTFHALVAFILIQLGISEVDGKIFAAIIHGTQVVLVLGAGLISWVIMMKLPIWGKPEKI
ncbi:lysylphosphatidylglycerol synthase transmembrane domain-containing protein [Algoriphagus sp. Y33]|uniref:lysylphosphatidylglycerol synthase transmembrane domain-containing protein n=1 Tax=Algoriphagus sp. Y33 TaxID=2772483 RepID=UPI001CE1CEC5|nr:lysylphosphatidylglycerol synthase transmembrane domain-containing protein [Algoriphagus sp. Y33]